ncbi:aminotransferase class-III [Methylobacterium sp. ME121]|nr:aminotransferase class-III [Methylobacterium sp. ME121]
MADEKAIIENWATSMKPTDVVSDARHAALIWFIDVPRGQISREPFKGKSAPITTG